MMHRATRIVVIDDERDHLDSLVEVIEQFGIPCQSFHYTGEEMSIAACPNVRLIFADLHLVSAIAGDRREDFSFMASLIEDTIKPSGPYMIPLWTHYPEQASALKVFLERLQGVTKPVDVLPLSKIDYLGINGKPKNRVMLKNKIASLAGGWLSSEGVIGLKGGWSPLDDREVDRLIEEIYTARKNDTGRVVELED